MISFDIRTLMFTALLSAIFLSATMFFLWRANPAEKSLGLWAEGGALIVTGFILLWLRGQITPFWSVLVANSAIAAGYCFFLLGARQYCNLRINYWPVAITVAGVFLSFFYFTYVSPSVNTRIVIISCVTGLTGVRTAQLFCSSRMAGMRLLHTTAATIFGLHGGFMILRALITLFSLPIEDFLSANRVTALTFSEVILSSMSIAMIFAIMTSRRLVLERNELDVSDAEKARQLTTFFENFPGMAYRCRNDTSWSMEFVSSGATNLTGYRPDEIGPDGIIPYAEIINPEDRSRVWKQVQKALSERDAFDINYRIKTASGEERIIWERGTGIYSSGGDVIAIEGIMMNVTEQNQVEEALRQAQKMEAVGQLTGGIAHDFNNMLGVIMGNLDLLRRKIADDSKAVEFLEAAYTGSQRCADITKKLLGFSRRVARTMQLIDVNQFIRGMEALIAKSMTPKIALEIDLAENIWSVNVDPGDLEDALLNLVLNARDAMPQGGVLTIETANKLLDNDFAQKNPGSSAGEYLRIRLYDTGSGMPPDTLEKAFQPFFTTKTVGKGTGLGLSMVFGFVQRSGGHIKVLSEPDHGTTIDIYLPRAAEHRQESKSDNQKDETEVHRGDEKVLVVDDEPALLKVAASFLEELGYQTLTATSSDEALSLLQDSSRVDLLFTDVVMPGGLDGMGLGKKVKQDYPGIKVLLTSGFTPTREDTVEESQLRRGELGANLLSKPYSKSELARAVRQTLDAEQLT